MQTYPGISIGNQRKISEWQSTPANHRRTQLGGDELHAVGTQCLVVQGNWQSVSLWSSQSLQSHDQWSSQFGIVVQRVHLPLAWPRPPIPAAGRQRRTPSWQIQFNSELILKNSAAQRQRPLDTEIKSGFDMHSVFNALRKILSGQWCSQKTVKGGFPIFSTNIVM